MDVFFFFYSVKQTTTVKDAAKSSLAAPASEQASKEAESAPEEKAARSPRRRNALKRPLCAATNLITIRFAVALPRHRDQKKNDDSKGNDVRSARTGAGCANAIFLRLETRSTVLKRRKTFAIFNRDSTSPR